jgi:hypothetical protein
MVGISQRRTRAGALFQCAALVEWEPSALLDLLVLPEADRSQAAELAGVAIGSELNTAELTRSFAEGLRGK